MSEPVPVLFIAGTGRSGSTVMASVLGSISGAVSVGEVRQVWRRGWEEDWTCGCGETFHECRFWHEVLETGFPDGLDVEALLASERELLRLRNSPRALRLSRRPELISNRHLHYLETLDRLYRAIRDVSGARVVVDSSKTPSYAALLSTLPGVDLRLLHLIRDPRAAAHSWLSPKASPDRPGSSTMDRLGVLKSTLLWIWWNRRAEVLAADHPETPRLLVRYEAFMDAPEQLLDDVIQHLAPELRGEGSPLTGRTALLVQSHTVSGNPDRMRQGAVQLVSDERWQHGLAPRHQTIVTTLAGATMRRHGFPGRGHGHAS